jgi:uncharacterized YccA/Bax inhibitor family protein
MSIPFLALIYAVVWGIVQILGTYQSVSSHKPVWYTAAGVAHGFITLGFFIGYWVPEIVRPSGILGALLFVVCLIYTAVVVRVDFKKLNQSETKSGLPTSRTKWILIWIIVCGPVYLFGGTSAWNLFQVSR